MHNFYINQIKECGAKRPRRFATLALCTSCFAFCTLLTACGLYQKYETPTGEPIIKDYAEALQTPVDSTALGNLPWQQVFTDPLLQSYIQRALDSNKDLQNAKLNIDIARAQLQGAKLSFLPSVNFSPNFAGSKISGIDGMDWGWQLPVTVSWQVDIFGQLTNNKRSAESSVIQSEAYAQAVQSQIIAGVATTYYTLVSLRNQLNIYNENLRLWEQSVQMMRDMKIAGRYTEVAVVQAQANYHSVRAAIPDINRSITQAENTMSLLLGTEPRQWAVTLGGALSLPANLHDGVPMNYLAARPDVRAAEQDFAKAFYATNVARANFYPQLNITATGAYGTLVGGTVFDPAKWLLNLAGSLTAPIFNRGRNIATLKAAKATQQQALNNFSYSILDARAEVSDALAAISSYSSKLADVQAQRDCMALAVDYNRDLMNLANATYLEVITAQQQLLQAQIQLELVKMNINTSVINLYQALGGGR